jgi:hypothetical protein
MSGVEEWASLAGLTFEGAARPPNTGGSFSLNAFGVYTITAEEEKGPQRKLRVDPQRFCRTTGDKPSLLVAGAQPGRTQAETTAGLACPSLVLMPKPALDTIIKRRTVHTFGVSDQWR